MACNFYNGISKINYTNHYRYIIYLQKWALDQQHCLSPQYVICMTDLNQKNVRILCNDRFSFVFQFSLALANLIPGSVMSLVDKISMFAGNRTLFYIKFLSSFDNFVIGQKYQKHYQPNNTFIVYVIIFKARTVQELHCCYLFVHFLSLFL